MSSEKEKLLLKKLAEVDALKRELDAENLKAFKPAKKAKKKFLPKLVLWGALIFIGLPIGIATIAELSMTPQEKEARETERADKLDAIKIKIATEKAERDAASALLRIDELVKKADLALENKNAEVLLATVTELENLKPEKTKKYAAAIADAKAEKIEKERKRKLNFTGNFTIGNYTDEFGDRTTEKFVGYRGSGQFSNSATEGSPLNFWIALNSQTDFDISLYEYAGNNPVKDIFGGDAFVIRFKYDDQTGSVTCKNSGDRISCGPQNSAKLHNALETANQVKFSIYNKRTTSSQYSFIVNANGYTNAMRKLYE
ncbi:hypothetical protein ACJ3XI_02200 [Litorimonas sp. RW-G-Af-16]|uniref:hypothetical protein n=1 Tax=Litorimonas sp. RW-G-Af-16 TaxID=3241168 RepID=UPI00390C43D1